MAGCALILFGVINVLHEIYLAQRDGSRPGLLYTLVTAALFAAGAALLLKPRHSQKPASASRLSKD
jgi:hypothetical protein